MGGLLACGAPKARPAGAQAAASARAAWASRDASPTTAEASDLPCDEWSTDESLTRDLEAAGCPLLVPPVPSPAAQGPRVPVAGLVTLCPSGVPHPAADVSIVGRSSGWSATVTADDAGRFSVMAPVEPLVVLVRLGGGGYAYRCLPAARSAVAIQLRIVY